METSRGKQMVKKSIEVQSLHRQKRKTPRADARFWCETGLDKDGFRRDFINREIGYGLFATANFRQGDFLLEYVGTRLSGDEVEKRNRNYALQQSGAIPRCYMYHFKYKGKDYCIDATLEKRGLARFINDAHIKDPRCNAKMKQEVFTEGYPRLCLYAIKDIAVGDEIRYDYGEDTRFLAWRKQSNKREKQISNEDWDDDPFDVEAGRERQKMADVLGVSEITDVSDINDPDYELNEESTSSKSEVEGEIGEIELRCDNSELTCHICSRRFEKKETLSKHLKAHYSNTGEDKMMSNISFDRATQISEGTVANPIKRSRIGRCQRIETIVRPEQATIIETQETIETVSTLNLQPRNGRSQRIEAETAVMPDQELFEGTFTAEEELPSNELTCPTCLKTFKKKGALSTHLKTHSKSVDQPYKKPKRPCFYCLRPQSQLRRHLTNEHSDEVMVKEALSFPEKSKDRHAAFEKIRKQGIYNHNKNQAGLQDPQFLSERSGHAEVTCSKCHGFYSQRLYYRHREICIGDGSAVPSKISSQVLKIGTGAYETDILSRFNDNEVGNLCRNDPLLVFIGRSLFSRGKGKVGKEMEVRKSVMQDMRLLARLYLRFKIYQTGSNSIKDMFHVRSFDDLERAIEDVTKEDGKLKYGVKQSLKYNLYTALEKLIGYYTRKEDDDAVTELQKFSNVLRLHANDIFADSVYAMNFNRQEKLRMPEQQANEKDIQQVRNHLNSLISNLSSELTFIDRHEFITLRDAVCSRLTLFNARRGGEPSRLIIQQVKDAINGRWVRNEDVEQLADWEQQLFKEMIVTFQAGKGNHLVPVLIPDNCIKGIQILCDKDVRKDVEILDSNEYVFASTGYSPDHVVGWHCINKMSTQAGITAPEQLTASKQRHRISTLYSSLDVPESERHYFYKHMGHSREVNAGTYQNLLPIQEVTKVGRHLQNIDRAVGEYKGLETSVSQDQDYEEETQEPLDRPLPSRNEQPSSINVGIARITAANTHSREKDTFCTNKEYFQWSPAETAAVRRDFSSWINIQEGNKLPSKKVLEDYVKRGKCRFDYKRLRTKIMNEQNTRRLLIKKRMKEMCASD